MLIQQYFREFNELASKVKFLSVSDEVNLANKLKLIQTQFIDEEVASCDIQDFFTNLYLLLSQSVNIKSNLLENCLDILSASMNSRNGKVRTIVLSDCRFLSILVSNLISIVSERELVKILTVIQDFLSFGNELDEHNLKLIVEVLRDHSENTQNKEISALCINILINLCLNNDAARYVITRVFKASHIRSVVNTLNDDILAIKVFILLEDELTVKDIKYFVALSSSSIIANENFDYLPIKNSIDVLRHFQEHVGINSNSVFNDDKLVNSKLRALNDSLIVKLQTAEPSYEKSKFFETIFQFFNKLLELDNRLVNELQSFVDVAFITADISKSPDALKFLASYIKNGGKLEASELVVESLVHHFATVKEKTQLEYEQTQAFMSLLSPLEEKDLLSDQHLNEIKEYFQSIISSLDRKDISQMEEEEVFHFIFFLHSLTCIAKNHPAFLVKLNKILQMDLLPVVFSRAHRSTRKDILALLLQLSGINNFPIQAVAKILSEDSTRTGKLTPLIKTNSRRRDCGSIASVRFMSVTLANEFESLIERVNQKLDDNEPVASQDLIQLYRQKIKDLNDQLESVTANLNNVSRHLSENQQRLVSFRSISDKQDFKLWCVQMDKDRMCKEVQVVHSQNALLKKSLEMFKLSAAKEDAKKESFLKQKTAEIEQLKSESAKTDEKLRLMKENFNAMSKENEARIEELKAEVASVTAEHKKSNQKSAAAEKEIQKLQELIKLHEKDICAKQEKLQEYEVELKDAEQMKTTIMNLMQGRSFRK